MLFSRSLLFAAIVGVIGLVVFNLILTDPIWAVNLSLISSFAGGTVYFAIRQRRQKERIRNLE